MDYGIPHEFVHPVMALHCGTSVKVRLGTIFGKDFQTQLGLRQGCVLAPVLFNLYLDHILKKVDATGCRDGIAVEVVDRQKLVQSNSFRLSATSVVIVRDTQFADDVALVGSNQQSIQTSVSGLYRSGAQNGLNISIKKTKAMTVGAVPCPIKIADSILDNVDRFTYLGSEVDSEGGVTREVTRRIGMALAGFNLLMRPLWKRREITIATKMRMFRAFVLSRLLYGGETWAPSAVDLSRLEACQTYCLRRMLRLSWMDKVKNDEVRRRCLQQTLEAILRQKRLRWLGHVQRMNWQRLPKVVLWGRLQEGSRSAGGQKKRWVDVCTQDLKSLGILNDWKTLCLDRHAWATKIKAEATVTRRESMRYQREQEREDSECESETGTCASVAAVAYSSVAFDTNATVPISVRASGVRATVEARSSMSVVCEACHRRFARESDKKRHKCVTSRPKR